MWLLLCSRYRSCHSCGRWRSPIPAALVLPSRPISSMPVGSSVSVSRLLMFCPSSRACPFPSAPRRLLVRLLRWAAPLQAYRLACASDRKDIVCGPTGILDVHVTAIPWRLPPRSAWRAFARAFPLDPVVAEAVVTGSALTADRLFRAGFADSPQCRFCSRAIETLQHLVECPSVATALGHPPPLPPGQGPAFATHALVELSPALLGWLVHRSAPRPLCQVHQAVVPRHGFIELWTDGSAFDCTHPLCAVTAYAVVDADRRTLAAGEVRGAFANNYVAEVAAIVIAVHGAGSSVCVYTDCNAAAQVWQAMRISRTVPSHAAAADLWTLFWEVVHHKQAAFPEFSVELQWTPAHQDLTQLRGRALQHALCNDAADRAAKAVASGVQRVPMRELDTLFYATWRRQRWLQQLYRLLPECSPFHAAEEVDPGLGHCETPEPAPAARTVPSAVRLPWEPPGWWHCAPRQWAAVRDFFAQAEWRVGDSESISLHELVIYMNHRFPLAVHTPGRVTVVAAQVKWARKALGRCGDPLPGVWKPSQQRSFGVCFPKGMYAGASLVVSGGERELLAQALARVHRKGRTPRDWDFALG